MANQSHTPSPIRKSLKLFLLIFVLLLVPVVMDQAEVNRETVRLVGRVAAGLTLALFLYGVFTKSLKVLGFVIIILITLVVLVCEGKVQAPRVKDWLASRGAAK